MPPYPPMPETLRTERLTMRWWTGTDAEELRALHAERDGAPAETIAELRTLIARMRAMADETGITTMPVTLRETGELLGYCGLIVGRATIEEPEIVYEFFRRFHGLGYATEAARAVLAAVAGTGRERLWATVRAWNKPSFRVLEKLGFARERVETDDRGELVWLTAAL